MKMEVDTFESEGITYKILNENEVQAVSYFREDINEIDIPETVDFNGIEFAVTCIGDYAFGCFNNLETVHLPASLTHIGKSAFNLCKKLETIILPPLLTHIGDDAFAGSGLASVTLPESLIHIGISAFSNSNIESIVIPNKIKIINESTFAGCDKLTSVKFSKYSQLETIDSYAFRYCESLSMVTLPASLLRIEYMAFGDCDKLLQVIYRTKEKPIISEDAFSNKVVHIRYC